MYGLTMTPPALLVWSKKGQFYAHELLAPPEELPIWRRLLAWSNTIRHYWLLNLNPLTPLIMWILGRNESRISKTNFPGWASIASACDIRMTDTNLKVSGKRMY